MVRPVNPGGQRDAERVLADDEVKRPERAAQAVLLVLRVLDRLIDGRRPQQAPSRDGGPLPGGADFQRRAGLSTITLRVALRAVAPALRTLTVSVA